MLDAAAVCEFARVQGRPADRPAYVLEPRTKLGRHYKCTGCGVHELKAYKHRFRDQFKAGYGAHLRLDLFRKINDLSSRSPSAIYYGEGMFARKTDATPAAAAGKSGSLDQPGGRHFEGPWARNVSGQLFIGREPAAGVNPLLDTSQVLFAQDGVLEE